MDDTTQKEKRKGAHTPKGGDVAKLAALTGISANALYGWCAAGLVPGATHDGARKRWRIDANALTPAALEQLHVMWERHQRSHGAPDTQRTLPTSSTPTTDDAAREAKAQMCRTAAHVAKEVSERTMAGSIDRVIEAVREAVHVETNPAAVVAQPRPPLVFTPTPQQYGTPTLCLIALALWAIGCACAAVVLR
jgi:hypothetical protein